MIRRVPFFLALLCAHALAQPRPNPPGVGSWPSFSNVRLVASNAQLCLDATCTVAIKNASGVLQLVSAVSGTNRTYLGSGNASFAALWLAIATPSTTNFAFGATTSGDAIINMTGTGKAYFSANNGGQIIAVNSAGTVIYGAGVDSSGTPGNATLNGPKGKSAFPVSAVSVTITNNQVDANSIVYVVMEDAPVSVWRVVPSAGSFTVSFSAVTSAVTKFRWFVVS